MTPLHLDSYCSTCDVHHTREIMPTAGIFETPMYYCERCLSRLVVERACVLDGQAFNEVMQKGGM